MRYRGAMYGVYVHIPWCRLRCPYCAFAVSTRRDPPHAAYTDAVVREWALRRDLFPGRPASVFFGGGTPSLCPPDELARILAALAPLPGAEVSMEANPGDLPVPLSAFRDAGITRLSLGVQSFDPAVARRLGRGHTSDDARALVAEAKATGFASVSFDLIFAVPGQTLAAFEADLAAVVALAPDHVSLYGLTIEPDTAFARARTPAVDEDLWRAMYDAAVEALEAAGIERYEVSNFARPGHRSCHNEHYWRARPWAGLGASAHAWWPDGTRAANVADVDAYLAAADPLESRERPAPRALAYELLWSTLRHVDGADRAAITARTGLEIRVDPALVRGGLVVEQGAYVRLTAEGFPVADAVAARLADALVDADPGAPLPVLDRVSDTLDHPASDGHEQVDAHRAAAGAGGSPDRDRSEPHRGGPRRR
jgi:oxygen-independent coproporphyrinogen-3 oxidase